MDTNTVTLSPVLRKMVHALAQKEGVKEEELVHRYLYYHIQQTEDEDLTYTGELPVFSRDSDEFFGEDALYAIARERGVVS